MADDEYEDVENKVALNIFLSLAAIVAPLILAASCDSDGGGYRGGGASFGK
ncbi:hypothetical protein [Nocardiopsis sp. LOL_012]|uniref:hypothetical protein n=1 Tax=Nocardiopsis sp. LOL_012 TaxID=3345409 RepID=UPI003A8B205B